ncbi:unnamed protein product [Plutella xylostella]|uniref:(diamondback moth) hypothetical protein n=1 Tax=Plutella xylostella TaxID=51655 RepID=A0A8S4G7C0_PLUXY|nr:unnamed protein product [Plutella xylostella]
MRWSSLILALALTALSAAAPAPGPAPAPAADPSDDSKPEIIEIIAPANPGAQETLASLDLGAPSSELGDRNKRTIGILRQLFPQLTQILEQKVQQLTSVVLQTFGPVVLRAFLGNRGGEGGNTGGGGAPWSSATTTATRRRPVTSPRRRASGGGARSRYHHPAH